MMQDNPVEMYVDSINSIFTDISNTYNNSIEEIKEVEQSLTDLLHEIELSSDKDMYQGYLLYKEIKALRIRRRQAKERVELLKGMYDFVNGNQVAQIKNTLGQLKGNSKKTLSHQNNRVYSARQHDDLTIENKHTDFEDLMKKFNETKRLFNFYPALCIIEGILSIGSTIFAITTHNIIAYYIIDTLIFSIVTRNICCGGIKLRAMRYNTEEQREQYDNNNNSANAIGTIVGSCLAMILDLDFEVMLIIATIGNTVDNIFYICIYYNERKKISESKINKSRVS